jgi:beta-phosphoglucomutase-like phosphatase (HAD superfamily)
MMELNGQNYYKINKIMTKLIIFDLDGVLVEAKQIHYDTLNQALKEIDEKYVITEAEHLSIYDGLKTTQKLELLTKNKGLHPEFYDDIWYSFFDMVFVV